MSARFTGATTAFMLAQKELGDVVLVDIPQLESPTKGKALDMLEAGPVQGVDSRIVGTSSYEDAAGSDIVIITAGIARKPGMSRDDLVNTNAAIVRSVCENVKNYCPDATVIVLSNPVDAMTYVAFQTLGFPKNRVIGQSGVLDTARYCTFIAAELNVFRGRCARFCAWRPWRRHGPARALFQRRRDSYRHTAPAGPHRSDRTADARRRR
ncbi:hypothetical protein HMSSN036_64960 [Paenibacillus macerans]|nr:hypothetical protein HMSSN036_64960 [Paenibacillus macerans]